MLDVQTYSLSLEGRRENNQDSFSDLKLFPNLFFIAVADGMGGVAGGKQASESVLKCCEKIIKEKYKENKITDLKQLLRKIFYESQKTIREEIKKKPELNGMGTTLTCVLIIDDKFVWGNLGDSRIYYYTNSELKLITKDHTHIQEFIDENKAPLTQSMIDSYGNYLTRSIDGGTDEADIFPEDSEFSTLKNGEGFLLCSDGLIDNKAINNASILKKYIIGTKDLKDAATKLYNMALENGSTDNITVVLLEKGKIKRKKITNFGKQVLPLKKIKPHSASKSNYNKISAILGSLVSIVALLIFFIFFNRPEPNQADFTQGGTTTNKDINTEINKNLKVTPSLNNQIAEEVSKNDQENEKIVDSSKANFKTKNEVGNSNVNSDDVKLIKVPNVVGLDYSDAKIKLEKLGLKCTPVPGQGSEKDKGKVIKCLKSGTMQKLKSQIIIVIGK